MLRRVVTQSTSLIARRFSSSKKPPPGFEKFFKKRENTQTPKPSINFPSQEELQNLQEKKAAPTESKEPIESESSTKKESTNPAPSSPQEEKKSSKSPEDNPKEALPKDEQKKEEHRKDDSKKKQKKQQDQKPNFEFPQSPYPYLAVAAAVALFSMIPMNLNNYKTITYQEMLNNYLYQNKIHKMVVQVPKNQSPGLSQVLLQNSAKETLAAIKVPDSSSFLLSLQKEQVKMGKSPADFIEIEYSDLPETQPAQSSNFTSSIVSLLILGGFLLLLRNNLSGKGGNQSSGGGFSNIFNIGKSNFKVYGTDKKINVSFKDVAGQGQAKKEITEFVEFLKAPEKFKKLGARMPRGALLVGPPGTGKTLLAKASAGEAGVPFFSISGSEFVEMFVGVGASRVRDLFKQAREKSPSIIFIDEIDAVGRKRDDSRFRNDERDTTLNQLLVEMDGFSTDTHVIVMAATNRQDTLDSALLRPGRFDRIVEVSLPDLEGRKEILMVHLLPIKLHPEFNIDECSRRVAALTPGFSGADLSQLCNEAAILAARQDKEFVTKEDFESASEKVMLGVESSKKLTPREKKIVSYHEAGHAVAGWFLEGADPVLKVSILPRSKGALGFAQNMPKETPLYSEQEFLDKICMILGGRVSEQIFFASVTNGASDDLKKATQLAQALVETFGMSDTVGLTSYSVNERYYSEHTKDILDTEVRAVINKCMIKTRELLNEKKDFIIKLAERLIEKEGVVHNDLVEILGPRPFEQSDEYKKFISEQAVVS